MTETCLSLSLDLRGYTKLDVLYLFKRNFLLEKRKCKVQTVTATCTFLKNLTNKLAI